jgi:hypothetical protein
MIFKLHPDAEERRRSAYMLTKMLLGNQSKVVSAHLDELLGILLWKITEAEATKYRTRYQSQDALRFRDKGNLRHDHVYQRSKMIEALKDAKSDLEIEEILDLAVGCTVTYDEHMHLNGFDDSYGWYRYRKAGITVIDTSKEPPVQAAL